METVFVLVQQNKMHDDLSTIYILRLLFISELGKNKNKNHLVTQKFMISNVKQYDTHTHVSVCIINNHF